jgi:prepilin-type N-terminal cleavage/methylation domain-containing protein
MIRQEEGFTLVELLMAIVVMSVGILTLLGVLDASGKLTLVSERQTSMAHRAQLELERVQALPFAQVSMIGTPTSSTDPANPGYYVTAGGAFEYDRGNTANTESFAVDATSGAVSPNPIAWSDPNGRFSGNIYDFVSWVQDPNCSGGSTCESSTQNYKRLTVAITLTGAAHPSKPVLVSTLIADPASKPKGWVANGVQNPLQSPNTYCGSPPVPCTNGLDTGTPMPFFPCDTSAMTFSGTAFSAYNTSCTPPTTDNPTHGTIAPINTSLCSGQQVSGCQNPDLLGSTPPPQDVTTPSTPVCYSSDIGCSGNPPPGGTTTGGRTLHRDVNCSVTPTATDQTKGAFWVTNSLSADTTLTGDGGMTLYAETAHGVAASVTICVGIYVVPASLLGLISLPPVQLGVVSYTDAAFPSVPTPVTFNFNFLGAGTTHLVAAGNRIGLRVWIAASSADDVTLLYDHPNFATELELNAQ